MVDCIAIYLRVSLEDGDLSAGDKEESNSITNQRRLIRAFLQAEQDLKDLPTMEFADDGWTGTNFERPGFQRMLDALRTGAASVVIVKDLSRFGRNYLEVGDYLEHLFPFLGVRFIAINDGYDSASVSGSNAGISLAFKNILHDYYSRDLSAKVRSAQRSRMQTGEYVNTVPYGYLRDPADRHHLIADPVTAPIVRELFQRALQGEATADIARDMNRRGVPTPCEVKGRAGHAGIRPHWNHRTVLNILGNYKYTGAMVNHSRENETLRAKSQRKVDRSEWIVTEGMHEALVTHQNYHTIRERLRIGGYEGHREPATHDCVYYCAYCGRRLRKTYGLTTYLSCETPYCQPEAECAGLRWKLSELEEAVTKAFQARLLKQESRTPVQVPAREGKARQTRSELSRKQQRLDQLQTERVSLYTDFKCGKLTREEFIALRKSQADEAETLKA